MIRLQARFDSKVDSSAGLFGCWPWQAKLMNGGYGQFWLDGRNRPAAQVALERALGRPLGDGMFACHTCDNPPCVNPAHLFEGTPRDNTHDMVAKGRSTKGKFLGERNPSARLTEDAVREIRRRPGLQRDIAAEFGVDPSTVSIIRSRRIWRHLTDGA